MGRMTTNKISIEEGAAKLFFKKRAQKECGNCAMQLRNPCKEQVEEQVKLEAKVVKPKLKLSGKEIVLDVGCGTGHWGLQLRGDVARYHGFDFVEEYVEAAELRFKFDERYTFQVLRASEFSGAAISAPYLAYDVILCAGMMSHLPDEECRALLSEMGNMLSTNGKLYLREPVSTSGHRLMHEKQLVDNSSNQHSAIYRTPEEYQAMFAEKLDTMMKLEASESLQVENASGDKNVHQYYIYRRAS